MTLRLQAGAEPGDSVVGIRTTPDPMWGSRMYKLCRSRIDKRVDVIMGSRRRSSEGAAGEVCNR